MARSAGTCRAQRIDQHALQRRPASARGQDYALIDLQFDSDVVALLEAQAQVRGQPVSFAGIGGIAAYAKFGSGCRERFLPASAHLGLPTPPGVVEQTY